jgi:uncharacterized protein YuzE
MARYEYRHAIDFDADDTLDEHGRAILKAAFAVAERAHHGQSRKKIDPSWQYICHPIMVYDIMRRLGENDPIVLAAAILHDAIEDNSEFKARPEQLCDELIMCLYKEGVRNEADDMPPHDGVAHAITDAIHQLCMEVTNPKLFDGDGVKENYQHDRIEGMTLNAKKIKIADQAASLICNLTMANNPESFTLQQEIEFTEKAHTLGVGIFESVQSQPAQREALLPFASFLGKTLLNVYPLIGTSDGAQKEQIREGFDFDTLFKPEPYVNILPPKAQAVERLTLANDSSRTGVTWVDFDRDGKVIGYAVWTAWDHPKAAANEIQKALTQHIRSMRRIGGQYIHGSDGDPLRTVLMPKSVATVRDTQGNRLRGIERVFALSPALNAMAFAAAAREVGAIDRTGWNSIRDMGDAINRAQEEASAPRHPRINPKKSLRWHD